MKLFKHKLCILLFSFILILQLYSIVSYASIQISKNTINTNLTNYGNSLSINSNDNTTMLTCDELEVLTLINNYREQNNMTKLTPISSLQNIAHQKAEDIINYNYFSHTSPNFGNTFNLMQEQNVSYNIAGENLAGNINSESAVNAWINSKSHKENILTSNYKYTGIAVINSEKYGKVFVQIFIG